MIRFEALNWPPNITRDDACFHRLTLQSGVVLFMWLCKFVIWVLTPGETQQYNLDEAC